MIATLLLAASLSGPQLVPLLTQVLKLPTYEHNDEAFVEQKAWLLKTGTDLGFVVRDAGPITEIELPATTGDHPPVLGLMVHGDVQPVDADAWSFPPFSGKADDTYVYGRGSADDKGPLVQALVAMHALQESGVARTHTIRLLVGSDEESSNEDIATYLKSHAAPDYSLVLDSTFPVVVGEKAWNALTVTTPYAERGKSTLPYGVMSMWAGLSASIVPDHAEVTLAWNGDKPKWQPVIDKIRAAKLPEGTRIVTQVKDGDVLKIVAYGRSAHAGVNIEGGRNALLALAIAMKGMLPAGGANDLLAFARIAGQDLYGTGLGFTRRDPLWGRYAVNVAMIKTDPADPKKLTLTINIRSTPPRTGEQLQQMLYAFVKRFNARTGAALVPGGYFADKTLGFDPQSPLVVRLLDDYARATGKRAKPAISGGGTYAKRIPNAIAFGMWFPDKPYPGHDVDEKNPIADLELGTKVLLVTLTDLATGPPMKEPLRR
jgi:succinyl-diaminopimelate desuccinylase